MHHANPMRRYVQMSRCTQYCILCMVQGGEGAEPNGEGGDHGGERPPPRRRYRPRNNEVC